MLWITGNKGLLGSTLCQKLKEKATQKEGSENGSKSCKAALHVATGREVDIADRGQVERFLQKNPRVTHIINCAAFSAVDPAETFREEAFRANVLGPENLAFCAKEVGIKLVHFSTDYVFSGNGDQPLKEQDPVGPCNYYGVTKLQGEENVLSIGGLVIRTSWIFGKGGKNFACKLLQMLQSEKVIRLTSDQWGRYTFVSDLSEVILNMLDAQGLFQFANQGVTTKYEFGKALCEEALLLGYPVLTDTILPASSSDFPTPCKRPKYSAFDTSKIETFVQNRHWKSAMKDFLCEQIPAYL